MILGLDLGGTVGFCHGLPTDPRPVFGHWKLPRHLGAAAAFHAFRYRFEQFIDVLQPAHVCVEARMHAAAMQYDAAAEQAFVLDMLVRMECWCSSIPFHATDAGTIRMELLGRTRTGKKKGISELAIAQCHAWGWSVANSHEADAALVWAYYAARLGGGTRARQPKLRLVG